MLNFLLNPLPHFGESRDKVEIQSTHSLLCRKFAVTVVKLQLPSSA